MQRLTDRITRLPASENPLSADVFLIRGDRHTYVYDVGACDEAADLLCSLPEPPIVILSHFHRDHTGNIARVPVERVYVGARTRRQLGLGVLVEAPVRIEDGVTLEIRPCVSPHAPGCLIVTVDGTHTLIGDLAYACPGKGQGEARGMLRELTRLETAYFVPSHAPGDPVTPKERLLTGVREWFHL